jgi:hypothetical protein
MFAAPFLFKFFCSTILLFIKLRYAANQQEFCLIIGQ